MVYRKSTYHCETCHKSFSDEDDAERCEVRHIVDDAAKGFRDDIADIMKRPTIHNIPKHDRRFTNGGR